MRGERHALRAGEYLVSRACRKLPARIREERYQEWLADHKKATTTQNQQQ